MGLGLGLRNNRGWDVGRSRKEDGSRLGAEVAGSGGDLMRCLIFSKSGLGQSTEIVRGAGDGKLCSGRAIAVKLKIDLQGPDILALAPDREGAILVRLDKELDREGTEIGNQSEKRGREIGRRCGQGTARDDGR